MSGSETIFLALLVGFGCALVMSRLFIALQARALPDTLLLRAAVAVLMVLAAPHILALAAAKTARLRQWPTSLVAGCYALSVLWAAVLGLMVVLFLRSAEL